MKTNVVSVVAAAAAVICSVPAVAHHSFNSVFDRERPIDFVGRVTLVEWMIPHVWFYIDVENEQGDIEKWSFEMGSPNGLIRRGWNHKSLEVGQVVTVVGAQARDGSQRGSVRTVTLPTGESLFGAQNDSR